MCWRVSSVVKSSYCSCTAPKFNSQQLHCGSQPSIIPAPGYLMPYSRHAWGKITAWYILSIITEVIKETATQSLWHRTQHFRMDASGITLTFTTLTIIPLDILNSFFSTPCSYNHSLMSNLSPISIKFSLSNSWHTYFFCNLSWNGLCSYLPLKFFLLSRLFFQWKISLASPQRSVVLHIYILIPSVICSIFFQHVKLFLSLDYKIPKTKVYPILSYCQDLSQVQGQCSVTDYFNVHHIKCVFQFKDYM